MKDHSSYRKHSFDLMIVFVILILSWLWMCNYNTQGLQNTITWSICNHTKLTNHNYPHRLCETTLQPIHNPIENNQFHIC